MADQDNVKWSRREDKVVDVIGELDKYVGSVENDSRLMVGCCYERDWDKAIGYVTKVKMQVEEIEGLVMLLRGKKTMWEMRNKRGRLESWRE